MKKTTLAFALLAASLSTTAMASAAPETTGVSVFGGYSHLELKEGADQENLKGYEYGLRGVYALKNGIFGKIELSQAGVGKTFSDGSEFDIDNRQIRVGGGYAFKVADNARFYGEAQYAYYGARIAADGDGATLHNRGFYVGAGISIDVTKEFVAYSRLGVLSLEGNESDGDLGRGLDMTFGAGYTVYPGVSVFTEIEYAPLTDRGFDTNTLSARAGAKYSF